MFCRDLQQSGRSGWLELLTDILTAGVLAGLAGTGLESVIADSSFVLSAWLGISFYAVLFTGNDRLQNTLIAGFALAAVQLRLEFLHLAVSILYLRAWQQLRSRETHQAVPAARLLGLFHGLMFILGAVRSMEQWTPFYTPAAIVLLLFWPAIAYSKIQSGIQADPRTGRWATMLAALLAGVMLRLGSKADSSPIMLQLPVMVFLLCLAWVYFRSHGILKKHFLAAHAWFVSQVLLVITLILLPSSHNPALPAGLALMALTGVDLVRTGSSELRDSVLVFLRLFLGVLLILLSTASAQMGTELYGVLILFSGVILAAGEAMAGGETDVQAWGIAPGVQAESQPAVAAVSDKRVRVRIGDAIRKDTPGNFRKDIYFYFMEGSWSRLFLSMFVLYLLGNLFFASIYVLLPGSVIGGQKDFISAFFFSVQTMSTIGYGSLSPGNTAGNVVVTVEAAVGLLGVALVTGLVFAKASRPQASILFSSACIRTTMNGSNVLAFRTGNARGNDIVDARLDFSVLVDTRTREGHSFRKVTDLKLVRNRTPFFRLTWLVMHVIDEDSPLHGLDLESDETIVAYNAVIVGHDGIYGQTVYARHTWYPEDIRDGHDFVDVIETRPDGRLVVDYSRFHQTKRMNEESDG
jgi:inward rectifier potassium channel